MSYTLYNHTGSGGFVIEAGLILADQPYRLINVDTRSGEHQSDAFLAINPWAQVPALVLPDGAVMTESAAMAIYLADSFPDAGLAPAPGTPERAAFLRWIIFMTINIYEGDLRYYYADRYTTDPKGVDGVKEAAVQHTRRALETVEEALQSQDYLLGTEMSLADVYLAMVRVWFRKEIHIPKIDAIVESVRTHPKLSGLWARNFEAE